MRNYVIINGVNSLDIQGLAINNLPPITKPMIRTQREEIDGRDGDIVTELGYSAYDKQMEIGLYGKFDIDAIIKYFTGEGTIVFSNEEDKYYNFKILDQIDYEKLLKFKTAVVTFHCQPFKYPLEEEPVEAEITTITGTGESITLENVEEAPMKIVYKGNTYQYSTSGKNLIGTNYITGITINDTTTNDITIRGNWASTIVSNANLLNILEPSTTYTISYKYKVLERPSSFGTNNSVYILGLYDGGSGLTFFGETQKNTIALNTWDTITRTFTTPASLTNYRMIAYDFKDTNNTTTGAIEVSELQIEKGSSATSFEKFTNGASPNPDYPQEIQVVSGDNSIVVCGKNLLNPVTESGTINITTGQNQANAGCVRTPGYIDISFTNKVKFTRTGDSSNAKIRYYDKDFNYISGESIGSNALTKPENCQYVRVTIDSSDLSYFITYKCQLEAGETASTYEPYTGASYPISLGVENIATSYKSSGSGYFNYSYDNSKVSKNMTLSFMPNFTTTGATIYARPKDNGALYTLGTISTITSGVKASLSFTLTDAQITEIKANTGGFFQIYRTNVDFTESSVSEVQLEVGTKKNRFTPYGTTPIELCKIGTYQDKIDKSTGKNLYDNSKAQIGKAWNNASNTARAIVLIKVKPSTTYYLSYLNKSAVDDIYWFDRENENDSTYITGNTQITQPLSITTKSNCNYLGIQFNKTSITQEDINKVGIMLNEGTTALEYEPYGTGWYLKKEIGKVVLDGSETRWSDVGGNAPYKYTSGLFPNFTKNETLLSNYYECKKWDDSWSLFNYLVVATYNQNAIQFRNVDISSFEDFKIWLSTHNVVLYYVLATPTYTPIEGELLNQLEAIKMSYEGQTNISQTNNDLAFELDVSVTFLTPMEINNIGNIYAKPILTIEGTGNIGVVLNGIQILDIDLSNNGKITIDVPKLEAYNPDDDTLLNRLVTGDYMKLLINEGENKITFTGEVSGATLTSYTRWI